MILYLCSYINSQAVSESIEETGEILLEGIVESRISLLEFINLNLDKFKNVKTFIIDLNVITDSNEEIIDCMNNLRVLEDYMKIIILANQRETGDSLLNELFSMGIYNITIEKELEPLKEDVKYCINVGKAYKDSLSFKTEKKTTNTREKSKIKIQKEIIVKNQIVQTVSKALIGFLGAQPRIGATHQVIVNANYLKRQGQKVAVVECQINEEKAFEEIKDSFDITEEEDFFSLNQIDFYQNFDLQEISRILNRNYNFILLDMGVFRTDKLQEFSRCTMQTIICGSKPWEMTYLNKIFASAEEDIIKEYFYVFNYTDQQSGTYLKKEMGILNKVYLAGYSPDPFNHKDFDEDIKKMYSEFIPLEKEKSDSVKKGWMFWKK